MREHLSDKRRKLSISFSGGRTSAYMLYHILNSKDYEGWEIIVQFANTGCEHESTLKFVHECDLYLCRPKGVEVIWLEGVYDPQKGIGPRAKRVTFETASRKGEPFEQYIKKYGIPNRSSPHCTARLKEDVMDAHKRSIGWNRSDHWTAIGIRADEMDRVSVKRIKRMLCYPLAEENITKDHVMSFWANQPFDLELSGDHWGNCTWCWKKSKRKLMTLALEDPSVFDFPARMEAKYGFCHKQFSVGRAEDGSRRFFRENLRAVDIIHMAKTVKFTPYSDAPYYIMPFDEVIDMGDGCEESCEIGTSSSDHEYADELAAG